MEAYDAKRQNLLHHLLERINAPDHTSLIVELENECFAVAFPLDLFQKIALLSDDHQRNVRVLQAVNMLGDMRRWKVYYAKARSMIFNLTNPKNPNLREKFLEGVIPPAKLVRMSHQDMFPEHWEPIYNELAKRDLRKLIVADKSAGTCNFFRCNKCGKRETTYSELQTRRADEGSTIFVYCTNCSNRWKI